MKLSLFLVLILFFQSCSTDRETYYTVDDFQRVNKMDTHVHIFTDRNDFMEQAKKDNFKLITITLDPDNVFDTVKMEYGYCLLQHKRAPESISFGTSFSMEGWDEPGWQDKTIAWLDSGINAGAITVKFWKNIGMSYRDKEGKLVMIDNPGFDPIFKMLADRKITVLGHLGEPKNCWLPLDQMTTNNDRNYFKEHPQYHMFKHPEMPSYEAQIAARDNMLAKNPNLTFVGAHVGSLEWDVDELAKRLDRFPNMAVDLAARMGQIFYQTHSDREKVRNFFIKYQDRMIYATDLYDDGRGNKEQMLKEIHDTWTRDWRFFVTDDAMTSDLVNENFQGLKLSQKIVDKIFYKNAQKWFHAFEDGQSQGHAAP